LTKELSPDRFDSTTDYTGNTPAYVAGVFRRVARVDISAHPAVHMPLSLSSLSDC
jgi:hypothetical protein